jgi:hypothetical protein
MCHCATCHETFGSESMFALHRVGGWDARRCLTPVEMACLSTKAGVRKMERREHAGTAVWHRHDPSPNPMWAAR